MLKKKTMKVYEYSYRDEDTKDGYTYMFFERRKDAVASRNKMIEQAEIDFDNEYDYYYLGDPKYRAKLRRDIKDSFSKVSSFEVAVSKSGIIKVLNHRVN